MGSIITEKHYIYDDWDTGIRIDLTELFGKEKAEEFMSFDKEKQTEILQRLFDKWRNSYSYKPKRKPKVKYERPEEYW